MTSRSWSIAIRAIASVSARGEDHAGRVVRAVEQQQPGLVADQALEPVQVGPEVGRRERERDPDRARHRDVGHVGVVVGLERDHLVARLEQGEQGGRDRLGRPRGDQHLGVRVVAEVVEPPLVARHRLPELGDAGGRRVLVAPAGQDRLGGRVGDGPRAVDVGEPLAEVDRAGGDGAGRHLAEDRVAEAVEAAVEQRSSHQIRLRRSGLGWAGAYRVVSDPGQPGPGRQPVAGAGRAARGRRRRRRARGVPRGDDGAVRLRPAGGGGAA